MGLVNIYLRYVELKINFYIIYKCNGNLLNFFLFVDRKIFLNDYSFVIYY